MITIRSFAVWVLWTGLFAVRGVAAHPEPPPEFSRAKNFRGESRLHDIAFVSANVGVAVGDRGVILRTDDGGEQWRIVESQTEATLEAVRWTSARHAVAVGGGYDRVTGISRGVVCVSADQGNTWRRLSGESLPKLNELAIRRSGEVEATGDFSFSQLADRFIAAEHGTRWQSLMPHGFVEGDADRMSPGMNEGSVDIDRMSQWSRLTSAGVPMRAECSAGDAIRFAAGDHGVICRSVDGGQSWSVVRGPDRRTSVLVVTGDPSQTPWRLIGSEAFEFQQRVAVLWHDCVSNDDGPMDSIQAGRGAQTRDDLRQQLGRLHQSVVWLGGNGADRQRSDPADIRGKVRDWLTIHSPSVLVIDRELPPMVRQVWLAEAMKHAIPRVMDYQYGSRGDFSMHPNALMPRLGRLAGELDQEASMLIAASRGTGNMPRRVTSNLCLSWLHDSRGESGAGASITSGLSLGSGRRLEAGLPTASRHEVQAAQARANLTQRVSEQLRDFPKTSSGTPATGSMTPKRAVELLLASTEPADHQRMLWRLWGETSSRTSSTDQAIVILESIAQSSRSQSFGHWAASRLAAIRASAEFRRFRETSFAAVESEESSQVRQASAVTVPLSPFQIRHATTQQTISSNRWNGGGTDRGGRKMRSGAESVQKANPAEVDLDWEFHPLTILSREAARQRGSDGTLQELSGRPPEWKRIAQLRNQPAWSTLLSTQENDAVISRRKTARPRLDGNFDDACWSNVGNQSFGKQRIQIRVSHDDDFLYFAVTCRGLKKSSGSDDDRQPVRDHPLDDHDRLRIRLDVDQDLMTSYALEVTSDRRTRDSVCGDPAWQPTWYIATTSPSDDPSTTRFEIAIDRTDLVALPVGPGQDFFLSVDRVSQGDCCREPIMPRPERWRTLRFR